MVILLILTTRNARRRDFHYDGRPRKDYILPDSCLNGLHNWLAIYLLECGAYYLMSSCSGYVTLEFSFSLRIAEW